MVSIQGIEPTPSFWVGGALKHFGQNLYGKDNWRVVWGPSRYWILGGMWEDRGDKTPSTNTEILLNGKDTSVDRKVAEYRWVPKYPKNAWVLEKWLSGFEYAGPRESYAVSMRDEETGLLTLGPYPEKGEYEECCCWYRYPEVSEVEREIQMRVFGQQYSFRERREALIREIERDKARWSDRAMAIFKDSQDAFNNKPSNVRPGKKKPEDMKLPVAAEDLGLPTGDSKFSVG